MDLSSNMVEIAMERAVTEKLPLVSRVFYPIHINTLATAHNTLATT